MTLIVAFLLFAMLAVLWLDITRYLIPNWLVGLMLLVYPAAAYLSPQPVDWIMALAAMGVMFAAGYVIFALKLMGGGDVKLLAACALWVGMSNLAEFLFAVAVIGGVFALGVWLARKAIPYLPAKETLALPRLLKEGEPIPYGVAIVFGFLMMLWTGRIPAVILL